MMKDGMEGTACSYISEYAKAALCIMENSAKKNSRRRRRNNQRKGLIALIGLLSAVLLLLLAVVLLRPEPEVELHPELTMEAGGPLPSALDFLVTPDKVEISYRDTSAVQMNVPGVYDITLTCQGKERQAKIRVKDTVNPTGKTQNLTALSLEIPTAEAFVVEMQDVTDIAVSYLTEPDKNKDGEQNITIVLTDTSGNVTHLEAVLTLIIDREAPVIEGVADKILYQGDTISYMNGVTVTDNMDTDPVLEVNRDEVDLATPGEYTVIYTATDDFGNVATATMKVTVLVKKENYVSYDVIYEEVDAILDQIITEDMTTKNQIWAIYVWIRTNCKYISHSDKDDWMQAAHVMMTERQGDCFNYFALCKLMMERLGIPNIDVRKVKNYEGDSNHYWSLASIDGGQTYYHVDTCPRSDPETFCLVTDAFMDAYSAAHKNCFNRDKSLYPATPEEAP